MSELTRRVSRKIDKAILGYRMITPGDRVLVGISGGKDSATLVHQLGLRQRGYAVPFTVVALHVRTEYAEIEDQGRLQALCEQAGVRLHEKVISVTGRLKPGRSMNCHWCSTQRRTELLRFAEAHDVDRIALGHHMDDILETFLMNITRKGEISTMLPCLRYDNYRQWVIRPLAWVTEQETDAYAREIGYEAVRCRCGFDDRSHRKVIRRALDAIIEAEGEGARERMMQALHNVNARYMPHLVPRDTDGAEGADDAPAISREEGV
jgi:tRNA 2-thiocytidine biosynthesis protein TtcA